MPPRVYADTSVIGGVFDPNFAIDSTWIFEEVAQGSLILLVSNVLETEVSESPESVRQVLGNLPASAVESVFLDARAKGLRDAYLAAKVVGRKSATDAAHVAIATVARADAFLSWDRLHIVGLARFARALHTAIKKGRGAHTFSCGRRCPAGADEGMRCAPWPANCPHPAVPATFSPREKERTPRRVCNSTVKRASKGTRVQ